MELLVEYASSSPSSSPPSPPASPAAAAAAAPATSTPAAPAVDELRRRQVAQQFAGRARKLAHRGTREEDAFSFRSYAAKRPRRQRHDEHSTAPDAPSPSPPPNAETLTARIASRANNAALAPVADDRSANSSPLLHVSSRRRFLGHLKAVNSAQWHPHQSDLFLSASMDATVRIWSSSGTDCLRTLTPHSLGVKSAKWAPDGASVLSGGYDGLAVYVDAETGQVRQHLRRQDATIRAESVERVTAVSFHPTEPPLVLLGSDRGCIYAHDLRVEPQQPVATFSRSFGDVHDLLALPGGQRFLSSAGIRQRDASNQTLLVWDWRTATLLFDRLDSDMLAFPSLRLHPERPLFVAQCSGNYASLFSSVAPYKRLKDPPDAGRPGRPRPPRRFAGGHEVQGFAIQCSFNAQGSLWASGDATGRVVLYRTTGTRSVAQTRQLYARGTPCMCAEFHPKTAAGRQLLTASSSGDVDLFL